MATVFDGRDKSRTSGGKTFNLIKRYTSPPKPGKGNADAGQRWQWLTWELINSPAFRTLSGNALKAFFCIILEHIAHGAFANGKLIITHQQFREYGVTGEYIADAIDELEYKGFIKITRGRAGAGTAHPNRYRLTFVGDYEGAPPTNEWKRCTAERCEKWLAEDRKRMREGRQRSREKAQARTGFPDSARFGFPKTDRASG